MDARGIACTSATGTNWTQRLNGGSDYVFGLTFAQGLFVGVGGPFLGGSQKITTSPNGVTWRLRYINVTNSAPLQAVAYGNGYFVAVGQKGLIVRSGPIFSLRPPVLSGGTPGLSLDGEAGRAYRIQVNTNPPTSGWQDLLTITNAGELMPFTDPLGNGETRLYRAVLP